MTIPLRRALLFLLLWSGIAPAADPFRVSVVDFGAVPGDGKDDAPAFQAAHDSLAARLAAIRTVNPTYRGVGTVFAPQAVSSYEMFTSVWVDAPFIRIQGEGEGSVLQAPNTSYHPIFIFGLRRQVPAGRGIPRPLVADASYRPDLFGKLDSTAVSAKGQRWGFSTHGDSFIQAQATALDAGGRGQYGTADNWLGCKTLTIELAVEGPNGGPMPGGIPLLCLGNPGDAGVVGPFTLHTGTTNAYVLRWTTQAKPFGPKKPWRLDFSTGAAVGPQRLAVQIDCNTGTVAAFNGSVVLAFASPMAADVAAGLSLAENDYYPLLIGDGGGARPSLGNVGGFQFSLYGCCLSRTRRYLTGRAGTPQRRADKPTVAINDRYRYFTPRDSGSPDYDPGTIGYLSFEDDPASLGRRMTVRHGAAAEGWGASSAFLLHSLMTLPGGIGPNSISDLRLTGGGHYGQNVAIGQVIEFKAERVRSDRAYHAMGSLSNGANYFVDVADCYLEGSDAGFFGNSMIANLRNVRFPSAGRATIRGVGCNLNLSDIFVGQWSANSQATLIAHGGDYSAGVIWSRGIVDYEGEAYQRAAVVLELAPYAAATTQLQNLWFGTTGGVPAVELSGVAPAGYKPAKLMLLNIEADGSTTPIVATAARWGVEGTFTAKPIAPVVTDPNQPIVLPLNNGASK